MLTRTKYCLILDDSFQSLDKSIWSHQVQLDGFGTGSFDWTTTDSKNAFTDDEGLHIVPTFTTATTDITEGQIHNGLVASDRLYLWELLTALTSYHLNLARTKTTKNGTIPGDGTCTANITGQYYIDECSASSNISSHSIINPIRSARLTTQGSKSIRYGRVEVVAKVPKGDWLWPAVWMMPEDSVYGIWPLSGEIDIMESRGNSRSYSRGGRETVSSTIHWGE
jgi:hypothetical protein